MVYLQLVFYLGMKKKKLNIDISDEKYESLKAWYIENYTALAKHYLDKIDATKFLNNYATKTEKYFYAKWWNYKFICKILFQKIPRNWSRIRHRR